MRDEEKGGEERQALDMMITMNRLLIAALCKKSPSDIPKVPQGDSVQEAQAAVAEARAALASLPRKKKRAEKKVSTRRPPPVDEKKSAPIRRQQVPWVPSSRQDGVSYNLLASCNCALKKQRAARPLSAQRPLSARPLLARPLSAALPKKKKTARRPKK